MKMLQFALAVATSGILAAGAFSQTPVPRSGPAGPPTSQEIGIANGIIMWGNDVIVTRNGVTERLLTKLQLPNGLLVEATGAITTMNGARVTLHPGQLLTFEGRLVNVPIRPTQPPTTAISQHQDAAAANQTQNAVEVAAKEEDQRRARSDASVPGKAGQSSQVQLGH
jgi:hypothetical protein